MKDKFKKAQDALVGVIHIIQWSFMILMFLFLINRNSFYNNIVNIVNKLLLKNYQKWVQ